MEKFKKIFFYFFFQAEGGIRGRFTCLEFRRVLFRSPRASAPEPPPFPSCPVHRLLGLPPSPAAPYFVSRASPLPRLPRTSAPGPPPFPPWPVQRLPGLPPSLPAPPTLLTNQPFSLYSLPPTSIPSSFPTPLYYSFLHQWFHLPPIPH